MRSTKCLTYRGDVLTTFRKRFGFIYTWTVQDVNLAWPEPRLVQWGFAFRLDTAKTHASAACDKYLGFE